MKKNIIVTLSVFCTLLLTGGAALAQTISNTGPGSNNTITSDTSSSCTVTNTNSTSVENTNSQSAGSGGASTSGNTSGGSATSGSASNSNNTSTSVSIVNSGCNLGSVVPSGGSGGSGGIGGSGGSGGEGGQVLGANTVSAESAKIASLPNTGVTTPAETALSGFAALSTLVAVGYLIKQRFVTN